MSAYSKRKRTLKNRIRVCAKATAGVDLIRKEGLVRHRIIDLADKFEIPDPPDRKSVRRQRCLKLPPISADALARIKPGNPKVKYARSSTVRDYPCKPMGAEKPVTKDSPAE